MVRIAIVLLMFLGCSTVNAQRSAFEECKAACYASVKKCGMFAGNKCLQEYDVKIDECKAGCNNVQGECSVGSLTDPYSFPSFEYAMAISNSVIDEGLARDYMDQLNRGYPGKNEFEVEHFVREALPKAIANLVGKQECLKRNSHVRLWRFMTLPEYKFKGNHFDFTSLRDRPFVIQNDCRSMETVALRILGTDEALQFSMNERDAEWLVKLTVESEPKGKVYGSVSIGGGGSSSPNFSDHGVYERDEKPIPEVGQANVGFYGTLSNKVEVRKVESDDPLAPVCTRGMTGTAADAALPTFNQRHPGTTRVLTMNVDELRIEDRRYGSSTQRREGRN